MQAQFSIIHLMRHSLDFVFWEQRKEMVNDLKDIYNAPTVDQAKAILAAFSDKWDATHSKYTTRKVAKNRESLPNDEDLFWQLYLAMMNTSKKWTVPDRDRKAARVSSASCFNIGSEPVFHSSTHT